MHVPTNDGTEPLGQRIIEMPEDLARTELRDAASGFVAYVPPGSIKRGESLVKTGGARTVACGTCHGADLKGLGPVPPLAGRSPSYTVRAAVRSSAGCSQGTVVGADEVGSGEADDRRHDRDRRVHGVAGAVGRPAGHDRPSGHQAIRPSDLKTSSTSEALKPLIVRRGRGWPASRTTARAHRRGDRPTATPCPP